MSIFSNLGYLPIATVTVHACVVSSNLNGHLPWFLCLGKLVWFTCNMMRH